MCHTFNIRWWKAHLLKKKKKKIRRRRSSANPYSGLSPGRLGKCKIVWIKISYTFDTRSVTRKKNNHKAAVKEGRGYLHVESKINWVSVINKGGNRQQRLVSFYVNTLWATFIGPIHAEGGGVCGKWTSSVLRRWRRAEERETAHIHPSIQHT